MNLYISLAKILMVKQMNKYQEAFKRIRSIQVFNEDIMLRFENNIYEGYEDIKLLKELVDKEIELQSRNDKLVVGSMWNCVSQCLAERVAMLQCYTRIMNIDNMVTIAEFGCEYVNFRLLDTNAPLLFTTPKEQFLLCFKPHE